MLMDKWEAFTNNLFPWPMLPENLANGKSYDVIWTAPRFNDDGSLKSPARITAIHNGVLVQNNGEIKGETTYRGNPSYKKHGPGPILLQDHGDPSEPISYRNIWVRELK